jgi:GABA(A) receptor-associated protein
MFRNKPTVFDYDKQVPLEKRIEEVQLTMAKHPNKIPIIVQKTQTSHLQNPNKTKFLVPPEQTVGQFALELRKRMNLTPEQALFLFVDSVSPAMGTTIGDIYNAHKSSDGFLKLSFCEENTFGSPDNNA